MVQENGEIKGNISLQLCKYGIQRNETIKVIRHMRYRKNRTEINRKWVGRMEENVLV